MAVWPPAALVDRLRSLERPPRPGLRWTTEDQWHVTLRFFGRLDGPEEPASRLEAVAARWDGGTVPAVAGPAARRLGDSIWVLPVTGLAPLAEAVVAATGDLGEPPPARAFQGHLTLARARQPAAGRGLPRAAIDISWDVDELTLVSSRTHPAGARYEIVGRWSLVAR